MSSLYILFISLFCLGSELLCFAKDNITVTETLRDTDTLVSSGGTFKFGFFSPPNSSNRYLGIRYNKVSATDVVWVANRNNPLQVYDSSTAVLKLAEDGNLQLLNGKNKIYWTSNVSQILHKYVAARILDTGDLVLLGFDSNDTNTQGTIIWQSSRHPTDTVLPNLKFSMSKDSNKKHVLKAWKSPSDPSVGRFSIGADSFVLPQLIIWDGDHIHYRSGPWNGNIFIGVHFDFYDFINAGLVLQNDRQGNISVIYTYPNQSLLSNYVLNYKGELTQIWWDERTKSWQVAWQAPSNECDFYGKCGEFGTCNAQKKPVCQCLKGFEPKNKEEWGKGVWSGGCVRRTQLQCGVGNGRGDEFLKLTTMKVPDNAEWSQLGLGRDDCRSQCLKNCSCLAYAYETGIGCMTWSRNLIDTQKFSISGVDLYLRLAHSELGKSSRIKTIFIAVAAVLAAIIASSIFIYILWRWKVQRPVTHESGKRAQRTKSFSEKQVVSGDHNTQDKLEELPLFDYEKIAIATDDFHDTNKLGQGGFGPVYKGKLEDGQEIAVKRLSQASGQGTEEFKNEVEVISKLQHRNLVKLLGCCVQGEDKMLIYEYMPNRSLDVFLFDQTKREILDWKKRLNIIEGICRGLLYLHRDSRLRIIHRDLKVSNILLDEDLNPKISDFGMARIFGGNQDQDNTNRVVGTYGYMAPEYAMGGRFSEKSDVFSFGVLLLEIICGIRNSSFSHEDQSLSLLGYAWKLWEEGKVISFIDTTISDSSFQEQISRCIQVGLLCVQEVSADRPNIATAMSMLDGEIVHLPNPKKPGFTQRQMLSEDHSHENSSVNYVSFTTLGGR